MKIIKESKVRPPKKYNLNLDESLFEAKSNKIKVGSLVTHKDDNPRTRGTVTSLKGNTAKVMVGDPANNDYVEVSLDDLQLDESITEEVPTEEAPTEDVPVEPQEGPKPGPEFGLASMLNTAIQDEWKTIDMYNSLAITATSEGYDDIAKVIEEITTEEVKHVGQLQAALKTVSPNAQAIDAGEREGEAQLDSADI